MRRQCRSFRGRSGRPRRGFSLAECAFSLLLTAVVTIGAMKAVAATQRTRDLLQDQRRSFELAQRIMTEIRQANYLDPDQSPTFGLESGEFNFINRVNYDDVDDYFSYTEMVPKDKDGSTVADSSGYRRFRDVDWVNPNSPTTAVGTDQGLKRITVTVTDPKGNTFTLVGLRSTKGIGEQAPVAASTYVEWAGTTITVGSQPSMSTGVSLINSPQ